MKLKYQNKRKNIHSIFGQFYILFKVYFCENKFIFLIIFTLQITLIYLHHTIDSLNKWSQI